MPKLTSASLLTVTGGEDRDHNSCINVAATTADRRKMIAAVNLSQCDGEYGYGDNTRNEFDVPLAPGAAGMDFNQCQGFQFQMGITPTGDDTWEFDAWLILHFDDGTYYPNDKLRQRIEASNPFTHKDPMFQCGFNFSHVSTPNGYDPSKMR